MVSPFPIFSFLALLRMFCMVSVLLHLGPLHVFLTPGRRNHFAYYNYHAYEGNAVFDTVLSLVTKHFSDGKSCVSLWQMKDILIYLKEFFSKGLLLCYLFCQLTFNYLICEQIANRSWTCCYPESSTFQLQLTAKFQRVVYEQCYSRTESSLIHLLAEFIVKTVFG